MPKIISIHILQIFQKKVRHERNLVFDFIFVNLIFLSSIFIDNHLLSRSFNLIIVEEFVEHLRTSLKNSDFAKRAREQSNHVKEK